MSRLYRLLHVYFSWWMIDCNTADMFLGLRNVDCNWFAKNIDWFGIMVFGRFGERDIGIFWGNFDALRITRFSKFSMTRSVGGLTIG